MTPDLILRSRHVIVAGGIRPATIEVRGERIERIGEWEDTPAGVPVDDYGELTLMAGGVDSHVHVNEPGRTEWEGFVTATRAAAAGGVTTIVDMPLNSIPPTTTAEALLLKAEALEGKCRVDVGLWGGAVPGNGPQLRELLELGALGFKCFLLDSGVPEFGHLDARGAEAAMLALRGTGAPLLIHAELAGPIASAAAHLSGGASSYRRYLDSRPQAAEDEAIEMVGRLAAGTGVDAHIVHLSSAAGIEIIRRWRLAGASITTETTPHYLYFAAEAIPDGAPEFKCAPPIREAANRDRLWRGLRDGAIDAVVSDHSPCTPELKHLDDGDVEHAWGGIASLQFALPVVWTEARRRGVSLEEVSRLMSAGPASVARIGSRKGSLAAGFDADVVVFAPEEPFVVTPDIVQHRHRVTPYAGAELFGVVKATYLRGARIWDGRTHQGEPRGRWIRPN